MADNIPRWLQWAREIQALSQTGLYYSETEYHRQRYRRLEKIAAEILAEIAGVDTKTSLESFEKQPGYATPKVDVRAAVFRHDQLLLVQERVDQLWCLPGGWADVGDSPAEMAVRETKEESGLEVRPLKIIGLYDANRSGTPLEFYHAYKVVFLCELLGGGLQPSNETLDARFFGDDEIPELSSQRTNHRHLADAWAHWRDPHRPADFD